MMSKKWRRRWEAVGGVVSAILFPPLILLVRLMPLSWVYPLGKGVALLAGPFMGRRRRIAMANLHLVFGRRQMVDIDAIYRDFLVKTITGFIELVKFVYLPPSKARGLIEIVGREHLDQALCAGKGVVMAGLHLGNFPLLATKLAQEGYPISVIIKKPRNRYLAKLYTRMTQRVGVCFIDGEERRQAAQESLRQLRRGGVVYIIIDQNPPYPDIMVDFFGYPVPSFKGTVVLALRTGAAIVPAFIVWGEAGRHRIYVEEPLALEVSGDQGRDVSQNLNRLMKIAEGYIERYPEQWWWWHRRWKGHIDYRRL